MSSENWKLENDLCRCCHSEGSFKNLAEPFKITDVVEIYADMLKECYDIDMAPVPGMLSAATYTICDVCIMRLRDASDFKKQALSCEERFKDMYNRNVIKAVTSVQVEVKQETLDSEPDDEFKEELSQDDNDDDCDGSMDLKISEEDETPLQEEVRKKRKYKTRTTVKNVTVKTKKKTKRKTLKQESADTENDAERKQDRVVALKYYLKQGEDYEKVGDMFHCARCEKTYGKSSSLRQHVLLKHRSPRYKCSICIEAFSTLPPLIVHKLEVHNVDDRLKCSSCNKMFNEQRTFSNHMKYFHMLGEKRKCEICEFETYSYSSMRNHIMYTHKSEKDLHCRFCKKSFKRTSNLNLHEKIHTGDRRKVCTVCGQAFVQKASLNYHMTKYHTEVKTDKQTEHLK